MVGQMRPSTRRDNVAAYGLRVGIPSYPGTYYITNK